MSLTDTAEYLAHHLRLAGRSDTLFSDDAVARIHKASRGLPRAVNNLAVQALIAAYGAGASIVDDKAARAAVSEVTAE
jgi:type II secretory pathway predicted ATPase ExeA